jgi:osmotically-inducible protein OsmY
MKSDSDIKKDVEEELRWDPDLTSDDIAVSVKDGVVMLSGFAPSYLDKYKAEEDAKRVAGVAGVANDIEVRLPASDQRPDPDIARDAVEAIKNALPFSHKDIKVVVADGWITLEGDAEWNYQREKAEAAARSAKGVKGIVNSILVKPKIAPTDIKLRIEEALKRNADIDANRIQVETHDGEVVLKGTVHAWFERDEAERAAWMAPGVRKVVDEIVIRP